MNGLQNRRKNCKNKVFNMSDCWKIAVTSEMSMLNYSIRR